MSVSSSVGELPALPAQYDELLHPIVQRSLCDDLIGQVVTANRTNNTYTIGPFIAEGAYGRVYACVDNWGTNLVAKVIKPLTAHSFEQEQEIALKEYSRLYELRHPTIVHVYDAFYYKHLCIIVMERCAGPLSQIIDRPTGSAELTLPVARSVLQALHELHARNLLHRDVHAGNVLYTFRKDAEFPDRLHALEFRLSDIGIAATLDHLDAHRFTVAPWQIAPEIQDSARFGAIDHRLDIWHTALLLLNVAVSQEIRFTPDEILRGEPRRLALSLDSPYSLVLGDALARHVINRPQSALEFWHRLKSTIY